MCGIAGFWTRGNQFAREEGLATAARMGKTLLHRGPDESGQWVDEAAGIGLASQRLAIIDLSPQGSQPMHSACGNWVIVYNGEVYNTAELRKDLAGRGVRFRGHSDTEVVLETCAAWGVEGGTQRLNGMFAFALWHIPSRTLHLVRDRLGIKPLYWGRFGDLVLFGSELKALRAHDGWPVSVNRSALAEFFRWGYVPRAESIYTGVRQIGPGQWLRVRENGDAEERAYWSFLDVARAGIEQPFAGTETEAVEALEELLSDAVSRRMVADVPLGAFLSGGIDSSTVVALMQRASTRPVRTFSIGFQEADYDEAPYARAVAQHLGTDHTELYVDSQQALNMVPQLPNHYDEPFSDSSQIPTCLLSALTKEQVTVSLSGDGGDELFGGYNRYLYGSQHLRGTKIFPLWMRRGASGMLRALSPATWDRLLKPVRFGKARVLSGHRLHRLAEVLSKEPDFVYSSLIHYWRDEQIVLGTNTARHSIEWEPYDTFSHPISRWQAIDTRSYLPGDILTKVDRASMAVSLEVRTPLLDHRVVTLAWRFPHRMKFDRSVGKIILRRVLQRHVPQRLFERPKMGFGIPLGAWLRGPLRAWAEELLEPGRLCREGFLCVDPIRQKWAEHLSGARNYESQLWAVLMFQAWQERWG